MQQQQTIERLRLDRLKAGIKLKLYEYPIILLSVVRQSYRVQGDELIQQAIHELTTEGFLTTNSARGSERLVRLVP